LICATWLIDLESCRFDIETDVILNTAASLDAKGDPIKMTFGLNGHGGELSKPPLSFIFNPVCGEFR